MARTKQKAPKLEVSRPVIVLSILSLVGTMICAISDFSFYTVIDTYLNEGFEEGNEVGRNFEEIVNQEWGKNGVDVTNEGLRHLRQLFLVIGILNVPVLLGVVLLFFRVRLGYIIYTVGQLAYIFVPLYFLGGAFYPNFRTLHYGDIAVTVLFIIMWGIQYKIMGENGDTSGSKGAMA